MTTTPVLTFDETVQRAIDAFRTAFNVSPAVASCAPGRVNLIGEHIDYNDGFVLPMALPMCTIIVGGLKPNSNIADILTLCDGADEPRRTAIDLRDLKAGVPKWANYVKGVIHSFGIPVPGFNAVIMTNVPVGGGLSSSAALEVATLTFLEGLLVAAGGSARKSSLRPTEKALVCQKAEHTFAGMPCGIMDQLVSVMAERQHALLIDCRSLETFQIPFQSSDLAVLICNSNVRHELSDSQYPVRRAQCARALQLMGLSSYREADIASLKALDGEEEDLKKRARHVITEIQRTREAGDALKCRDFHKMGVLMSASHASLRDDFEVSCPELDVLVAAALSCTGGAVLGARMTGGGFGGCTVSLVRKSAVSAVIERMTGEYARRCGGQVASFYVCEPSQGARLLAASELR